MFISAPYHKCVILTRVFLMKEANHQIKYNISHSSKIMNP